MEPGIWRMVSVRRVGDQRETVRSAVMDGIRLFSVSAEDLEGNALKTVYYSELDHTALPSEAEALRQAALIQQGRATTATTDNETSDHA